MKRKRILSAACAAGLAINLLPVQAFATEPDSEHQFSLVLDAADANGNGYIEPGEAVDLTISLEGLDWAHAEDSTRALYLGFTVYFDNTMLQVTGDATEETGYTSIATDLLDTFASGFNVFDTAGLGSTETANQLGLITLQADLKSDNSPELQLTAEKTHLFVWHFIAPDTLPSVETDTLFTVKELDFYFGPGLDAEPSECFNLLPTVRIDSQPKFDCVAPTVLLDGTEADTAATFYYHPIALQVTDSGSGVDSITLNDTPIAADSSLTDGGTLVARDKAGNTTSVQITVDAAAFDAAQQAAASLPETPIYTDKEQVEAAQAALDAVTDPAAQSKLTQAQEIVNAAAAVIQGIEAEIDAVEASIDALPETQNLTLKDVAALNQIEETLNALRQKGVTDADVRNYQTYTDAVTQLTAIRTEINAVKTQIDNLPDAQTVGFADEEDVQAAANALQALRNKYPDDVSVIDSTVGADRLKSIQDALDELLQTRRDLVSKIAETQFTITMFEEDVARITDLRSQVDAMIARGASFTADELKKLTDAEAAYTALAAQSKAAHEAVAALPSAEEILYSHKATIDAVAAQVAALDGKDTFTPQEQAMLDNARNAIAAIETEISAVGAEIQQLNISPDNVTAEDVTAVHTLRQRIDALLAKGVTTSQIPSYAVYETAVGHVQTWLDRIDALETLVQSLPSASNLNFTHAENVNLATDALHALKDNGLDSLVDEEVLEKLTACEAALSALNQRRAELVEKIAQDSLPVTLKQADQDAIAALRTEVSALEALGTQFTEAELANLAQAETSLAALQARSQTAHQALVALPGRNEVLYTDRDTLDQLSAEIAALAALGDTFTQAEQQQLADAQAGIDDMDAEVLRIADAMNALKDPDDEKTPVVYDDLALLDALQDRTDTLEARQCNVPDAIAALAAQDGTYASTYDHYTRYRDAVAAMEQELQDLNREMETALGNWTYGSTEPFDGIRTRMDHAAALYQIDSARLTEAFPQYRTSTEKNEAAKKLLEDAVPKINALPADITTNDQSAVQEITRLINQLKDTYGFTEELLTTELGDDRYKIYKAAVARLDELLHPATGGGSSSTPAPTATPAPVQPTAAPEKTVQTAAAPATIPQTRDALPLGMLLALTGLSLLGFCLILLRKRKL